MQSRVISGRLTPLFSSAQLSAPVVGVWLHEGSHLQRLDAPSPPSPCHSGDGEDCEGGEPVELMLVHYNSQYYIQPVVHTAEPDVWRGVGGAEGAGFQVRGDRPVLDAVSFAQVRLLHCM